MKPCFFCDIKNENDFIINSDFFFSRYDDFPVSKGHLLIISKRHISRFEELSKDEVLDFQNILQKSKKIVIDRYNPKGFNIGINEGKVAGQSVMHLHIHIIPRYEGDVENPIGGIRNILPKGNYASLVSLKKRKYIE